MISPVYHNLNTIDSVLKEHFGSDNVELIYPKDQKKFDFMFVIESGEYKMKMVVTETTALMMNNKELSWSYLEDSNNENSMTINRNSQLSNLGNNIQDIFEKQMFSKPYLESVMYSINENNMEGEDMSDPMELFSKGESISYDGEEINYINVDRETLNDTLRGLGIVDSQLSTLERQLDISTMGDISSNVSKQLDITTYFKKYGEVYNSWFNGNKLTILFNDIPKLV